MFSYMIAIVALAWLVYLGTKPTARRRSSHDLGIAGEAAVELRLRKALSKVCGSNFILHNSVILNISPGSTFPTAEVDHLVITAFGVFLVETKAWRGKIARGHDDDTLKWISPSGRTELRQSPLAQNRSKVTFLRNIFPDEVPIAGVGVFAAPGVRLLGGLPIDLITIDSLEGWVSRQLDRHRTRALETSIPDPLDLNLIEKEILRFVDTSPAAALRHKDRVTAG